MKIRYLNGNRLYCAFLAGGDAVIRDQAYLNKINVFPVPDADTGTNLFLEGVVHFIIVASSGESSWDLTSSSPCPCLEDGRRS